MKKLFRRIVLAFILLIFIAIIAVGIVIGLVFTPSKLTPIVRQQVAKHITCQSEIGDVELTFFSTFPRFGIKVNHFALINRFPKAPDDTLICADQFVGVVDLAAWWNRNELMLTEIQLRNGTVNEFVDSVGRTNFDIVKTENPSPDTAKSNLPFRLVNIRNVSLQNMDFSYIDHSQKLLFGLRNLSAQISGSFHHDSLSTHIKMSEGDASLNYDGENYFSNVNIKLNTFVKMILSKQSIEFINADAVVNKMSLSFNGTIVNDTTQKKIFTNINYQSKLLPVADVLALVPPSYQSKLKGVDAVGFISSDGNITGFYSDSKMPLMNMHFILQDGTLKYEGFPVPLSHINGACVFYSDMNSDSLSYFRIDQFSAQTPQSFIKTSGMVTHLFTDIKCDLTSEGNIFLAEFQPMIPASMKMEMKGRASGRLKSEFSMSQLEKMQLDKMNVSGSLELSDFAATYDSLSLKTDDSKVDFALPNPKTFKKKIQFISAKINARNLETSKLDGYNAHLKNALISLEASDVRDTTKTPDVACVFSIDSLSAGMDTIQLAIQKPAGQFILAPRKDNIQEPEINLTYSCGDLVSKMGSNFARMRKVRLNANILNDKIQPKMKLEYSGENLEMAMGPDSASMNKIELSGDLVNDKNQKDIYLQWLVKGFVKMDKGRIKMSSLKYPLEIPTIKMDFDPEILTVKESKLKIDHSDFSLSGTLSNVLSYFRKDSLLKGNFNFVSDKTDVLQLMQLTSGIGDSVKSVSASDNASGDPYMVPKGVDMLLNVDIRKATLGIDTARIIKGALRVKDGQMVLDGINFTTPAAKMKLTAIYRTPRTNHLYMGLDLQLTEVEIATLLKMFPDIDTIMPMLRSFEGKGEFHMAFETYLDSLYNPKKSTIRGAASIKGQDLVLMDGETFSEIAKTLKFSKKTFNKVDSLSAEFTVFKNEIDVYPFLIVMDKYKAVISGRHNLDLSFNYHISVVDSPLPLKFGIDVSGTMDNLKYRLVKCKYAEFYRPASQHLVQNSQLELRRMIRESLSNKVVNFGK